MQYLRKAEMARQPRAGNWYARPNTEAWDNEVFPTHFSTHDPRPALASAEGEQGDDAGTSGVNGGTFARW